MKKVLVQSLIFLAVAMVIFSIAPVVVHADTVQDQIATLTQQIAEYQAELKQAGADKKTLTNAIKKLQTQQALLQSQIKATSLKISALGTQLSKTQNDITVTTAKQDRIKEEIDAVIRLMNARDTTLVLELLSQKGGFATVAQNVQDYAKMSSELTVLRDEATTLRNTLTQQKTTFETQQTHAQELLAEKNAQQQSLNVSVQQKNQLLAETKNKESTYQKLLADAEAELKSFSSFTQNAGGAQLLTNQTSCDRWGCYYNQRDSAWGGRSLNGTEYSLASDGCLVTSMAMVMTHYGYANVTPETINANPNNFAAYYPAFLLTTISVAGVSATRVSAAIDSTLATGAPVVVGMRTKGGTHFVVLVSGRKGNYVMRDPYIANGKDIDFAAHYSVRSIYSVARVVIGG